QFTDKEQAESYCTALKKETDERTAADWLAVEKAKFLAENEPVVQMDVARLAQQPFQIFLAFRAGNRIDLIRVTKLDVQSSDSF
ncbi:hypothetical protein, partial [Faecalibacterium duncaniae]|uniref:hypothetical protein n=1 Tax=Faecalibacterium duncaniae (strain DSM 17677 / JCM 31915 / A2-165) TaxID=411483 RepID=UPI003ED8A418